MEHITRDSKCTVPLGTRKRATSATRAITAPQPQQDSREQRPPRPSTHPAPVASRWSRPEAVVNLSCGSSSDATQPTRRNAVAPRASTRRIHHCAIGSRTSPTIPSCRRLRRSG
uniref:(northern house mosquito) hypothetical protein n=1 Tax=Culex pipiens TaxID=7175 RepID=A0A8D8GQ24_CULPI